MKNFEANKKLILKALDIDERAFLGKGVESYVYSLGDDKVIRILKNSNPTYIRSLKSLQELISTSGLSVETSLITEINKLNGTFYTIEKRLVGMNLLSFPISVVFLCLHLNI